MPVYLRYSGITSIPPTEYVEPPICCVLSMSRCSYDVAKLQVDGVPGQLPLMQYASTFAFLALVCILDPGFAVTFSLIRLMKVKKSYSN